MNLEAFKGEAEMYSQLLPDIQTVLAIGGYRERIAPKLEMHLDTPTEIFVMEDLLDNGFDLCKNRFGLTDMKVVMSKLAQFHAASYYLNLEEKKDYSKYRTGIFNMDRDSALFQAALKRFLGVAKHWNEYKSHWSKLVNLDKRFHEAKKRIYNLGRYKTTFNVLNHGDFNIRNILVRRHTEQIVDFKMVKELV